MEYTYNYPRPAVTADCVVINKGCRMQSENKVSHIGTTKQQQLYASLEVIAAVAIVHRYYYL